MKFFGFILLFCFVLSDGLSDTDTIDHPEPYDESIDNYLTMCLENFAVVMRTGDPILGIPILDPFNISYIELYGINSHHLKMDANASDIVIKGISYYVPSYVHVQFNSLQIHITLDLEKMGVNGNYWCDGMFEYVFPIFGNGPFNMEVLKTVIDGNGGIYITDDGYLQITSLDMTIVFDELNVFFSNFLGGGDFGDQVNEAMSQMGKLLFDAMMPWLNSTVIPEMVKYLNILLMQHTLLEIIEGALPSPPQHD